MKTLRFGFKLHSWHLQFKTNNPYIKEIMKAYLPSYLKPGILLKKGGGPRRGVISFEIFDQTKKSGDLPPVQSAETVYNYANRGFSTRINFSTNKVKVYLTKKKYLRANWIYHGAFLNPFSLWLRKDKSMLMHGALLEKNKKGILLLGPSGSGKSTLSLLCVQKGYRYYSDEHPILSLTPKGRIRGRSFFSIVRVPPRSADAFGDLKNAMAWSKTQKKYFLNLEKIYPQNFFGRECTLSAVIFPRFSRRAAFSVKKVPFREAFQELCRDEYSLGLIKKEREESLRKNQLEVIFHLIKSVKVYRMRYGIKDLQEIPELIERLT